METALFSKDLQGITAEKAIDLWPYLKVDFDMHETQCPSSVALESPKIDSPPSDILNNSAELDSPKAVPSPLEDLNNSA
jgi:hypothetical protein